MSGNRSVLAILKSFCRWNELPEEEPLKLTSSVQQGLEFLNFLKLFGFLMENVTMVDSLWQTSGLVVLVGVFFCHGYSDGEFLFKPAYVFEYVPYIAMAIGPLVLIYSLLGDNGALWRSLAVEADDEITEASVENVFYDYFGSDVKTFKVWVFSLSAMFIMVKVGLLTLEERVSIGVAVAYLFWSYVMVHNFISAGLVLLAVRQCSVQVHNFKIIAGHVTDSLEFKVRQAQRIKKVFKMLGKGISPYMLSQCVLVAFMVSTSIGLMTRGKILTPLVTGFLVVAIAQVLIFWSLLISVGILNSNAKDMTAAAFDLCVTVRADRTNGVPVDVAYDLSLFGEYLSHNGPGVSIYGRTVDTSTMDSVFATHLTFAVFIAGPFVSTLLGT